MKTEKEIRKQITITKIITNGKVTININTTNNLDPDETIGMLRRVEQKISEDQKLITHKPTENYIG